MEITSTKRILSMLLAIMMMIGLYPAVALAGDVDEADHEIIELAAEELYAEPEEAEEDDSAEDTIDLSYEEPVFEAELPAEEELFVENDDEETVIELNSEETEPAEEEVSEAAVEDITISLDEEAELFDKAGKGGKNRGHKHQKLSAKGSPVTVEGELPEDGYIKAENKKPNPRKYEKGPKDSKGGEVELARYDITIFDADGEEWAVEEPVDVTIEDEAFGDGKALTVYYIDDDGIRHEDEAQEVVSVNNTVTFKAKHFSVYAVVESGEEARLNVVFQGIGDNVIASMYVKEGDNLDSLIYDPGAGTLETGVYFFGWTKDANYTTATAPMTIEEIRTEVSGKLPPENDGDEAVYYAMLFRDYCITYLDESGVSLGQHVITLRADEGLVEKDYTVNMAYTVRDDEHNFEGWIVAGSSKPNITNAQDKYDNGASIKIKGDVTFAADAPEGHWFVFEENGKGATYNAPQFVHSGEKPVRPNNNDMKRNGYTFEDWYTEESGGTVYDFGNTLTKKVTVYAHWKSNATANYTIIIWKQNLDTEKIGYDFAESITMTGTVGGTVGSISQQGTGVRISTSRYKYRDITYTGFHLSKYDQNVTVNAEGNTVVNVYFDRNVHTLTFQVSKSGSWTTIKEITALYGQFIGGNFPIVGTDGVTYSDGVRWDPQSNTPYTEVLVYIDIMPDADVTFHRNTASYSKKTIYYYVEALPGATDTVSYSNRTFELHKKVEAKYNYFTKAEDYIEISGFTKLGYQGRFYEDNSFNPSSEIKCYYTRNTYTLNFMDGVYVDGNGGPIDEAGMGQIETKTGILYESDISSYNSYVPSKTPSGYVFEGWYLDDQCQKECTFDKMPEGGITVYAKWRQKQYRVFLHPNYPAPTVDFDIEWGDSSVEMSFRIDYGGKISTPTGVLPGYEFVGWYLDEACTKVFNGDAYVLNDTTVKTAYDKDSVFTDYYDQNGFLDKNKEPTNKDKNLDRFWINERFDLYAKWRSTLDGADGIVLVYDATENGTNAPTDTNLYVDGAEAVAGAASTYKDDTKIFKDWSLKKRNGSEWVEDKKVLPGETFSVLASNAFVEVIDENTNKYTIKLVAEYMDSDKPDTLDIYWFRNDGTKAFHADEELEVNEAVAIQGALTRDGYTFKGWARVDITEKISDEITEESANPVETWVADEANWTQPDAALYLTYADGAYTITGTTTAVTKVAADENIPHQAMFGVWEENEVTINYAVASDSTDMGTVSPASETVKVETGKAEGSTATASSEMYAFDYWTCDDGTESISTDAKFVPSKNSAGLYEAHTYYAHFKLNKATVTVHHILKGTTTKVADDVATQEVIGTEYTAAPVTTYQGKTLNADSYDPSQKVTVSPNGNEITISYTLPLTVTAKTDSKPYDGTALVGEYTVEGALDDDAEAIEDVLPDPATITEKGSVDYPKNNSEVTGPIEKRYTYYDITVTTGTLTITADETEVVVTIKGNTGTETYDGEPHSVTGYEVESISNSLYTEADFTFSGTASVTGTDADTYPMGLTKDMFTNTNKNFEKVTFVVTDGSLTINPAPVTVTVTGENVSVTYDGTEHTATEVTFNSASTLFDETKVVYTSKKKSSTDVIAKTDIGYTADDFRYSDENLAVTFEVTDGSLEINPAAYYVVTENDSKTYDGEPLTAGGAVKGLIGNETATVETTGSQTEVGSSNNTYGDITWESAKESNYTHGTDEIGTLTVTPVIDEVTVTITGNTLSEEYNATEKTVKGYTVSISNPLYTEADFTFSGTASVTGTDADTYPMGLTKDMFTNTNKNFEKVTFVVTDGSLEITKAPLTITADIDTKVYDGKALTKNSYTNTALKGDDTIKSVKITGTITDVGTEPNVASDAVIKNGEKDVTGNYDISYVPGELEITPVTDEVTVTITGHKAEVTYDGTAHSAKGYDVKISNTLYKETDFSFNGTDEVTKTDAGSYPMGLKIGDFTNESKNFAQVKFVVTDGNLKINPATLTVKTEEASKTYDGTALTAKGTIAGFVEGETATFTVTGTQTKVGTSTNTYELTFDGSAKESNYTVSEDLGTLTVTEYSEQIVIVTVGGEKTYDGTPLNGSVKLASKLPAGYKIDTLSTNASVTHVSEGEVDVLVDNIVIQNLEGDDVTEQLDIILNETGKIKINPAPLTVVTKSARRMYNEKALTADGTIDGFVEGETATFTVTGTQTKVGKSKNTYTLTFDGTAAESDYKVGENVGELEVTPNSLTIQVNVNKIVVTYDGHEHSAGVETIEEITYNRLFDIGLVIYDDSKDVKSTNVCAKTAPGYTEDDFTYVNDNFDVTFIVYDGYLQVLPRQYHVVTDSAEKTYDGNPLTAGGRVLGILEGEKVGFEVTGSQTENGSSDNTYILEFNGSALEGNYIHEEDEIGTLTVKPVEDTVTVKIQGNTAAYVYNSNVRTVKGYKVTSIDNELYTADDFTFSGNDEVSGTDVDTYPMGLTEDMFTNTNTNFSDVKFEITDGKLTITKAPLTITADSAKKEYDGKALTKNSYTSTALQGDDVIESVTVTGSITEAGKEPNVASDAVIKNGEKDVTANYEITYKNGELEITKSSKGIKIESGSNSWMYDGDVHTEETYTVTYGDKNVSVIGSSGTYEAKLPTGDTIEIFTTASIKDTGTEGNDFMYTIENNEQYEGEAEIVVGNLEITKRQITLKANDAVNKYTGSKITYATASDAVEPYYTITAGSLAEGESITAIELDGEGKLAGSYPITITKVEIANDPENKNYDITVEDGTLKILDVFDNVDLFVTKSAEDKQYKLDETVVFTVTATNIYKDAKTIKLTEIEGVTLAQDTFENVPGGDKVETTATYKITEDDLIKGSFTNKVTAEIVGGTLKKTAEATVKTEKADAHVTIVKKTTSTPKKDGKYALGETITYKITAVNDGNLTVENITVTDELTGDEWTIDVLKPGESEEFTASYTVKEKDIENGKVVNVATGKGSSRVPEDPPIDPGKEEDPTEDPKAHITTVKETTSTPKKDGKYALGETITYKITCTNDGNMTVTNFKATDDLTGEEWTIDKLEPGESKEFTTSYKVTEKDIEKGSVLNEVTVTGDSKDPNDPPFDPGKKEDPTEDPKAHITIVKETTSTPKDGKAYKLGEEITYKITVKNDGNMTYENIEVTDELTGDNWTIDSLAPNAEEVFTASYKVTEEDILNGSVINEAKATGTSKDPKDPPIDPGKKEDPVEDPNGHITVTKETTSRPKNGKAYTKDEVIAYKITVKNDGNLTIKDISVADALTGDEWTIEALKPGEDKIFKTTYKVTEEDVENGKVTNVATASGTSPDPEKPDVPVTPGKKDDPTEKEKETPIIIPTRINVKVNKVWANDDNNAFGTRPSSITVVILRDGIPYKEVTLSEKNDWTLTLYGLPIGSYTIDELDVEGYSKFISDAKSIDTGNPSSGIQFTIVNTLDNLIHDHVAYIVGYPDGTVGPNRNITRAEVATIFFRLLTDSARNRYWSQTNPYIDVTPDAWYNNAISTLSNMGILNGYADGTFRPNSPITRAELTKIASSFFGTADLSNKVSSFTDVSSDAWYSSFITAAEELGLVKGYGDGTFQPDSYITRAEAITIINRTLKRAPDKDHLLPVREMNVWPDNMDTSAWYYAEIQEATNSHDYIWIEDSKRVEQWVAKLPERDWTLLERAWADANSSH